MTYGFIYCLGNPSTPGVYKLGMSVRSPRHRVDELSSATGVAEEFQLLFFGDVNDPRAYEQNVHAEFDAVRINDSREFFKEDVRVIFEYFESLCDSLALTQDGRLELMRSDYWNRFRSSATCQERADALNAFALSEGVKVFNDSGSISVSVPHHFYMSVYLRCAIDSLSADVISCLPVNNPSRPALAFVANNEDF